MLELFCGTGGHTIPVAEKGLDVVAVDASHDMLDIAVQKARGRGLNVKFELGDCRALPFVEEFCLIFGLGQSIHYLVTYQDLCDTFRSTHSALKPGGIFIFDLISGWRLLEPYRTEYFDVADDGTKILRLVTTSLDRLRRLLRSETTWVIQTSDGHLTLEKTVEENRILFLDELEYLLSVSGFETLSTYGDYGLSEPASPDCLVLVMVARRAHGRS